MSKETQGRKHRTPQDKESNGYAEVKKTKTGGNERNGRQKRVDRKTVRRVSRKPAIQTNYSLQTLLCTKVM